MSNVLKLDIEASKNNKFQHDLYYTVGKDEKVSSRYSYDIEKYSYSSAMPVKMEHSLAEDATFSYIASKKFDGLTYCELRAILRSVKVKEEYRDRIQICYPHNVGHNLIEMAEFSIDDDPAQVLDSVCLDIRSQYYQDPRPGKRDLYNIMIGNVPLLEEWSSELPRYKLYIPQPWFFHGTTRMSLLMLQSSKNVFKFKYKIRTKLTDLLRMRVKTKSGNYKEFKCNSEYLDVPKLEIPIPELWGKFYVTTDEERAWRKKLLSEIEYTLLYEDFYLESSDNSTPLGSTVKIRLQSESPTRHVFWVARNIKCVANKNNYSNYTTDENSLSSGWNPCAKVGIVYGGSDRIPEMDAGHFALSEAYSNNFPSAPCEPGYNVQSFSNDTNTIDVDTSVPLDSMKASLVLTLGDTDPYLTIKDVEEEYDDKGQIIPKEAFEEDDEYLQSRDKYTVYVRCLVYKKFKITWDKMENKLVYKIIE